MVLLSTGLMKPFQKPNQDQNRIGVCAMVSVAYLSLAALELLMPLPNAPWSSLPFCVFAALLLTVFEHQLGLFLTLISRA
jgi:hypothetical protein